MLRVKGLKNKISALLAGMLSSGDYPEFYMSMSAGFIGGMPMGLPSMHMEPVWSLAAYEKAQAKEKKQAEMEGVEKSILTGMADDIVVSVKSHWVELVVKKQFTAALQAAMPNFIGLSHVCIFVDDMMEAVTYYKKLLGVVPDHYLSHWKNEGFFKAAGLHQGSDARGCFHCLCQYPGCEINAGTDAVSLSPGKNGAGGFRRQ